MDYKISVDLLAGFKGSGKTSFINKMANSLWSKEKTLFIQNESGIESLSFKSMPDNWEKVEVRGGCICCTGSAYLEAALEKALSDFKPERIVLELAQTANLRDLWDLLSKIKAADLEIKRLFYIINAADFYKRMFISEIFLKDQLSMIPLVVVNRVNKLSEDKKEALCAFLKKANPTIEMIEESLENEEPANVEQILAKANWKAIETKKSPNPFTNLGFDYKDFINN